MWVIITLASLALLVILALWIPLDVVFRADMQEKPRFRLRFSWLFGLVSQEVSRGKKQPEEERKKAEKKRKPAEKRKRIKGILQIIRVRGLPSQLKRLVKDLLGSLNISRLVVNLKIGLDNPADTGFLFAFIGPAILFLHPPFPHRINIEPSFEKATFAGYSYGRVRLKPLQLVPPLLKFIFSMAVIRTVKLLVLNKWKRKK